MSNEDAYENLQEAWLAPAEGVPEIDFDISLADFEPHYLHDNRGVQVSFRLPENLARKIDILNSKEGIPHKTRQDFLREACFYYARALEQKFQIRDPRLQQLILMEVTAAHTAFLDHQWGQVAETLEHIHNHLVRLIAAGAEQELANTLRDYYTMANQFGLGFWRAVYLQQITELPAVQAALAILDGVPNLGFRRLIYDESEVTNDASPSE